MHALLDAHADRSKSCIDFGCGVGKYLPELSPRFKSVVGVDISQALLDKAMDNTVWSGNGRSRQRKLKNVKLLSVVVLGGFFWCRDSLRAREGGVEPHGICTLHPSQLEPSRCFPTPLRGSAALRVRSRHDVTTLKGE